MRISRLVTVLAGAGLVLLGPSALAASPSPTYPPQAPSLTVSANSIIADGSVTVTGRGFLALSTASVTWTGSGALGVGGKAFGGAAGGFRMGAKSASADASGVVTATVRLLSVGDHTITLAGTAADGSAASLSTVVTVTAAAVTPAGNLPHTGAPLPLYIAGGLMLVLLGGLVVMLVRSRRRSSAEPAAASAHALHLPVGR